MELGLGEGCLGRMAKDVEGSIIISLSKIASEQNNSRCGADLLGSREWISVGETGLTDPLDRCPCLGSPEREALKGRRFWDLVMYSFPGPTKDQGPLLSSREKHTCRREGVCYVRDTLTLKHLSGMLCMAAVW